MGGCFGCLKPKFSRKRKAKVFYSDLEKGTLDKSLTKLLIDQESDSEEVAAQVNGQGDAKHKAFVTEEEKNIIKSRNYHDLEKLHKAQEEKFSSEPPRKRSPLSEKIEPPWVKHSVQMKLKGLNSRALSLFDRKFGAVSDQSPRPTLKQLAAQEAKVTAAEEEVFKRERLLLFGEPFDEFEEEEWPGEGVKRKRRKENSLGLGSPGGQKGANNAQCNYAFQDGSGDRGSVQLHVVESGRNSARVLSADEDEEITYGNFVSFSPSATNKVTNTSPPASIAAVVETTPNRTNKSSLPDVVSHPSCQSSFPPHSPNPDNFVAKLLAAGNNAASKPGNDRSECLYRSSSPARDNNDSATPDSFVQHLSDHSDDLESLTLLEPNEPGSLEALVTNS